MFNINLSLIDILKYKSYNYGLVEKDDLNWELVKIIKIKKSYNSFEVLNLEKIGCFKFKEGTKKIVVKNIILWIDAKFFEIVLNNNNNDIIYKISKQLKDSLNNIYKKYKNKSLIQTKHGKIRYIKYKAIQKAKSNEKTPNKNKNSSKSKIKEDNLLEFRKSFNKSYFSNIFNLKYLENNKFQLKNKEFKINKENLFKKNFYNFKVISKIPEKKSLYGKEIEQNQIEFNSIYKKLFRIVRNEDIKNLKSFLNKNNLSTLMPKFSISNKNNLFDLCCLSKNDTFFYEYIKLIEKHDYDPYNINLNNIIENVDTGYNDKNVYGTYVRRVNLSRKNKIGNVLFNKDNIINQDLNGIYNKEVEKIAKNLKNLKRFKYLTKIYNNIENECMNNFDYFIEYNNYNIAYYLADIGLKRGYFGFTNFYKDSIKGKIDDLKDIKNISIKKKLINKSEFILINASFINPDKSIPLFLLNKLEDYNIKDKYNKGLLNYAAISKHLEIFDFLIKKGLNINDYDFNKITPLMMACKHNNFKIVEYIIKTGVCNINFKSRRAYAAIHYCVRYNSLECLKLLVNSTNINLKLRGPKNKCIVSMASKYGNNNLLIYLIENFNLNLSLKDKFGMNSLMYSIMNYNNDCLTTLLINGADINSIDSSGNSLIHYAAGFSNLECLKVLIDLGLDPNIKNIWNNTPLNIAYKKGNFSFIFDLIKLNDIDINAVDNNGRTIISNLITNLNDDSLNFCKKLLKQKDLNFQKHDIHKNTPLHYLAQLNLNNKLENLKNEINPNIYSYSNYKNKKNKIKYIYNEYFNFLFDINVLNLKNNENQTPIDLALMNNNFHFIDLLYEKKNNINKLDFNIFLINKLIFFKNAMNLFDFLINKILNLKNKIMEINENCLSLTFDLINYFTQNINKNMNELLNKKLSKIEFLKKFKNNNKKVVDLNNEKYNNENYKIILENFKYFLKFLNNDGNKIDYICKEKILEEKEININDNANIYQNNYNQYYNNKYQNWVKEKNNKNKKNSNKKNKKLNNHLKEFKKYSKANIFHLLFENYNKDVFEILIKSFKLKNIINYINLENSLKITPFEIFLLNFNLINDYNLIDLLILNNADINKRTEKDEWIINKLSKNMNFFNVINYIKNYHSSYYNNINFNIYDSNKINPIIYFCMNNNIENLKLIFDKIEINSLDSEKKTPLMWSIIKSEFEDISLIKLLLSHQKLNFQLLDIFNRNIFHYLFIISSLKNKMCSQVFFLFKEFINDYNLMKTDIYGNTAFHYYFMSKNNLINNDIIKKGDSVILKNNKDGINILLLSLLIKDSSVSILTLENCNLKFENKIKIIDYEKKEKEIYKKFDLKEIEKYNKPYFYNIFDKLNSNMKIENNYNNNNFSSFNHFNRFNQVNNEEIKNDKSNFENLYNYIKYLKNSKNILNDNYIINEYNIFQISLLLKNYEFCYKLLSLNYNDDIAVIDSIKIKDINYAKNLLINKIKFENKNLDRENILICYAKYLDNYDDELFNLIIKNYNNLYDRDYENKNALHYAMESLDFKLINKLLDFFKNDKKFCQKDNLNNNYLTILLYKLIKFIKKNKHLPKLEENNSNLNNNFINSGLNNNFINSNNYLFGGVRKNPKRTVTYRLGMNNNFSNNNYDEDKYLDFIQNLLKKNHQKLDFNYYFKNGKFSNILIDLYKSDLKDVYPKIFDLILKNSDINLKNSKEENLISLAILNNDYKFVSDLIKNKNFNGKILINNQNYLNLSLCYNKFCSYNNLNMFKILIPSCSKNLTNENIENIYKFGIFNKSFNWINFLKKNINFDKIINKKLSETNYSVDNIKYIDLKLNYQKDYLDFIKFLQRERKIKINNFKLNPLDTRCGYKGVIQKLNNKNLDYYMVKIDLKKGYYSQYTFYKMQFYYDLVNETYNVFTNWGKIYENGQIQITPFKTFEEGLKEFKKIYFQKTKNELGQTFIPHIKKYKLLNFKKEEKKTIKFDFDTFLNNENDYKISKTKIKKEINEILNSFIDYTLLDKKFKNTNLDHNEINMFDLEKNQLLKALKILYDIKDNIDKIEQLKIKNNPNNFNKLYDEIDKNYELSSKFYELFPMLMNTINISPINNLNNYNDIYNKLYNAIELEDSFKMILASQNKKYELNPIDYIYNILNCKIDILEKDKEEYLLLYKFIKRSYKEINKSQINIYCFESKLDENKIINKNNSNKRLLFHGTKTENMLSILKNGLLIDVPGNFKIGQMFGKGVYFADDFEKSLNYSGSYNYYGNSNNDFVLISEVTLGNMHKIKDNYNLKINHSKYDSIKCIGRNKRNKNERLFTKEGIMIPFGNVEERKNKNHQTYYSLNKNEYIIYDKNRIKIKYIVEIKK